MVGTAPLALLLLLGPAPVLGVHIGGSSAAISMELHTSQANGTGTDEELHTSKSTGTGNSTLMAAALVDEELGRAHCCSCLDNSSSGEVHIELPTSTKFLGFDCARCRQGCRSLPIAATACNGDGFAAKVKDTIGPKGFALKTAEGWLQAWHQRPKGEHFVDFVKATTLQVLLPAQPTGKNGETEKPPIKQQELTPANLSKLGDQKARKTEPYNEKDEQKRNMAVYMARRAEEEAAEKTERMTSEQYNLPIKILPEEEELADNFAEKKCGRSFLSIPGNKFDNKFDEPGNRFDEVRQKLGAALASAEADTSDKFDVELWISKLGPYCELAINCGVAFGWSSKLDPKPSCEDMAKEHETCRGFIANIFKDGEIPNIEVPGGLSLQQALNADAKIHSYGEYPTPGLLRMLMNMSRLKVRAEHFANPKLVPNPKKGEKGCYDVPEFDAFNDGRISWHDKVSTCCALPGAFSSDVGDELGWTDKDGKAANLEENLKVALSGMCHPKTCP